MQCSKDSAGIQRCEGPTIQKDAIGSDRVVSMLQRPAAPLSFNTIQALYSNASMRDGQYNPQFPFREGALFG